MAAVAPISRSLGRLRGGGPLSSLPRFWIPALSSSLSTSASTGVTSSAAESPPAPFSQAHGKERSTWSKWFLFLPGAITFGLGTWQIFRRHEKIKMLDYRQKRLEMEPMLLNSLSTPDGELDALEFRKVMCQGVFDEKSSVYVGPRSRSISGVTENGYYVITPLKPLPSDPNSVQSPILVNRGWVPRSWRENVENSQDENQLNVEAFSAKKGESRSRWRFWFKKPKDIEEKVSGVTPVEVIGVVRGSEKPSIFVPPNDPNASQWFWIDVPAIARTCGLAEDTIYIEDINENVNPSNPYPVPKDVNALIRSSVMPQDHLNYTITWYSLSAAVTFMAYKRLRPRKSPR